MGGMKRLLEEEMDKNANYPQIRAEIAQENLEMGQTYANRYQKSAEIGLKTYGQKYKNLFDRAKLIKEV